MKALVIGCGRVGSNIALQLDREGWEVTAVDEKEEALGRLGDHWAGGFVLGHGMDIEVLRRAGIEDADAVVVSTDGDNTNIVIGQVAQQRFDNRVRRRARARPGPRPVLPRAWPAHDLPDLGRDRRPDRRWSAPARSSPPKRRFDVHPRRRRRQGRRNSRACC
jgi:hypothetical protein